MILIYLDVAAMITQNVVDSIDENVTTEPANASFFGENLIRQLKLTRSQIKNTLEPQIRNLEGIVSQTLMPPTSTVLAKIKKEDDLLIKNSGLKWEVFKAEGSSKDTLLAWVDPLIFFPWLFSLEGKTKND